MDERVRSRLHVPGWVWGDLAGAFEHEKGMLMTVCFKGPYVVYTSHVL